MADTIGVVSLGCSKNLVDTERMLGLLERAGFAFTNDAAKAGILVVNTCGFIEPAKAESIDAILELARYKAGGSCHTLVVTGCLSERYREELAAEMPEIDILLGVREYERLPGLLLKRAHTDSPGTRKLVTPPFRAYLRVADGCDNRCAYCAIPLIRGPLKSVPMEALIEEARALTAGGVTELTLIAQDTSGYGKDIYGRPMLLPLMERLAAIQELKWLRLLYTYPDTVTPELVDFLSGNEKACAYLDMPLQHIDDALLRRMNRRGGRRHIEGVLDHIRKAAPEFMLRTTMMVGFPGETDAQFKTLLQFLRDYPFDRLGAFAFSPEEDTAAAAFEEQVPETVKQERLHLLMAQQQSISRARNEARVGREAEVLVEEVVGDVTRARSYAEAPEVDGYILLPAEAGHKPGMYLRARLTEAMDYDLRGITL